MRKGPIILIVDDDQAIIKLLVDLFTIEGYRVVSTNWGHEALSIIEKQHPDLVIMDVRLPDINGFEVTERLRAKRGSAFTPVIFLSENAEREQRLKGLSLGAEDFISKPFDIEELVLRVRNVLNRFAHAAQTNPISGLPENDLLDQVLDICLQTQPRKIITVTVLNMDQLRQVQGFLTADNRLRFISRYLEEAVQKYGDSASLVGQSGPNQFLLILPETFSDQDFDALEESLQTLLDPSEENSEGQETTVQIDIALKCLQQEKNNIKTSRDLRNILEKQQTGDE